MCAALQNVHCIVAPYEADAQMAYLSRNNMIDVVITEDSDLLVFGAREVFYKMDKHGNGYVQSCVFLCAASTGCECVCVVVRVCMHPHTCIYLSVCAQYLCAC